MNKWGTKKLTELSNVTQKVFGMEQDIEPRSSKSYISIQAEHSPYVGGGGEEKYATLIGWHVMLLISLKVEKEDESMGYFTYHEWYKKQTNCSFGLKAFWKYLLYLGVSSLLFKMIII